MNRKRVVYVGNNPTPYRIPVFNEVAGQPDFEFLSLFSTPREPIREWDLPPIKFAHDYLDVRYFKMGTEYVHVNVDIFRRLRTFRPDLVIISGFNPTCLFAYLYCLFARVKLGLMIDGTPESESHLTWSHRLTRRLVCPLVSVFFGPSDQTLKLFDQFGAKPSQKFKSHLCANNAMFSPRPAGSDADFDLIFCGRFADRKNPLFALELAARVSQVIGREVSLLMVGSGPLEANLKQRAAQLKGIRCVFPGFASQSQLPDLYRQAKVFIFPTSDDPWGLVANEACASGLPIVVTPHAGVVGELVIDGVNGHVLPLNLDAWTPAVVKLLTQPEQYAKMSAQCLAMVQPYAYEHAAAGMIRGIRHVLHTDQP